MSFSPAAPLASTLQPTPGIADSKSTPSPVEALETVEKKINDYFETNDLSKLQGVEKDIEVLSGAQKTTAKEIIFHIKSNIPSYSELKQTYESKLQVPMSTADLRQSRETRIKEVHNELVKSVTNVIKDDDAPDALTTNEVEKLVESAKEVANQCLEMSVAIEKKFPIQKHVPADGDCAFASLGIQRKEQALIATYHNNKSEFVAEDKTRAENTIRRDLKMAKTDPVNDDKWEEWIKQILAPSKEPIDQDQLDVLAILNKIKIELVQIGNIDEDSVASTLGTSKNITQKSILLAPLNSGSVATHYMPMITVA